jgi:hypothetical protein
VAGLTIVPQFVGLSAEEAQAEASRSNLGLIIEEREVAGYATPTVLEQDPPAGQAVAAASQVKLVVSRRLPSSEIPDVTGYIARDVQEGLESRGWIVKTQGVWSGETQGQILQVNPPVGTVLAAGEALTLTVSDGTDEPLPLEVNLNNMIFLESAELPGERFAQGETIQVLLRWRALQPVVDSYTVFFHLLGPGGALIDQDDHSPRVGDLSLPTSNWTPGVIVADSHTVGIPTNANGGVYQLRTGMYLTSSGNQRLPVLNAGQTSVVDNSILIKEIRVGP